MEHTHAPTSTEFHLEGGIEEILQSLLCCGFADTARLAVDRCLRGFDACKADCARARAPLPLPGSPVSGGLPTVSNM